jgi:endoglucanase
MRKLLSLALVAAAAAFAGGIPAFQANDTVCYVGDSITHGGTYHSIVTLFYVTRFPDRPIRFYNAGIGGDRASNIMADERFRLQTDILGHKPTVATVMLGMNDVNRNDYAADKNGPEIEERRRKSLDTYQENMHKLLAALYSSGTRLILIAPSIYEEAPHFNPPGAPDPLTGVNAALGQCGRQVRQFAREFDGGVVDFWSAMNAVNAAQRKADPMFSIVGKDRVHPGPVGHFVMAYTFLAAQNLPRQVAFIDVDAKKKRAVKPANCRVDRVAATKTSVEFDVLENALPLVVPDEARPALQMVPFARELNQEMLSVHKLKKGSYDLRIDGQTVGTYTARDLQQGVNLAENEKTPAYQQAQAVTKLNAGRTKLAQTMRDIAAQKYALSRGRFDVFDTTALLERIRAQAAKAASPRLAAFLEDIESPGKFDREYQELLDAMYRAAQPKPHHFALQQSGPAPGVQ